VALTAAEVAECDQIALGIIRDDVGVEIAEYYAAAVFFGDNKKPEQPNNEIRNALNHLARAYECDSMADAQDDLAAAHRHIKRAKRDSLKLAIIGLFDHLSHLLKSAEYHYGSIPPALIVRRSELVTARADAYRAESSGHSDATVRLQQVYITATEFLDEVQKAYPAASRDRKIRIFLLKLRRQALSIGIGFILGIGASLTAAWVWEESAAWRKTWSQEENASVDPNS